MKIIVICCLMFLISINAQEDSVSQKLPDSVIIGRKTDTVFISVPETVTVTKNMIDTTGRLFRSGPKNKIEAVEFWKKIDLITIINIIIFLLLGYITTKVLSLIRLKIFTSRRTFIHNLIAIIQLVIWIFIFYLIVDTLFSVSDLILLLLFLTVFVLIGFAAIPLIKNILGGFYILIKKPFTKGSYLIMQDIKGIVDNIEWRATTIMNADSSTIKIPNNIFLITPFEIIDSEKKDKLVSMYFNFTMTSDTNMIMDILRESAISSPFAHSKKAPQVFLIETDHMNKINKYKLNVWIFNSTYENELISSINKFVFNKIYQNIADK